METREWQAAAAVLRAAAQDAALRRHIQKDPVLSGLLDRAAKRYIVGAKAGDAVHAGQKLMDWGYGISLQYMRECADDHYKSAMAKAETLTLIRAAGAAGLIGSVISIDLSHLGLDVSEALAYEHMLEIVQEAGLYDMRVMISGEETFRTDGILALYQAVRKQYAHVGITLQANLHRTEADLERLLANGSGCFRLVKGAYAVTPDAALPRSEALNDRYLQLADKALAAGSRVSIASHDEALIEEAARRGYLARPEVEIEMLYGIRPELLRRWKSEGVPARAYVLYGEEWFLYVCHRMAEHPPNLIAAIADMAKTVEIESLYR
ncbi:proline dehydrogenase family protein [Paenibacillus sp. J5C2022]|uniref:proline dehydrogenase family protein n=1 Tax=Paenibacillus sp. J5C2022 TaxID=2977129 RepID=UPI0021D0DBE7|nr:proline dehydrogenase family protein [Paenibacillus sp. J5C2022]